MSACVNVKCSVNTMQLFSSTIIISHSSQEDAVARISSVLVGVHFAPKALDI
jgi:hypothetical protein